MADKSQWYVEGGFYETHAMQGEDPWADSAEFDILDPAAVDDVNPSASPVSFADLTKTAPY